MGEVMENENRGIELCQSGQKEYVLNIINLLNNAGFAVLEYKHGIEKCEEETGMKHKFISTGIVDLKIAPIFMVH
ncbi:MAG: hypothetical protein LBH71_00085 [Oscillospiraceae bacterium]|jgi:urocanate hydratase|nr:hypothetical protein [Oscillospiraceae bacterium]